MLSEFELQPLGLGIKKEFIASLFINNLGFVIFYIFQNFHQLKRVGAIIEMIFVDAFSQAKQNSYGMQCPAHFQSAAADTNTESNKNRAAPVVDSSTPRSLIIQLQ